MLFLVSLGKDGGGADTQSLIWRHLQTWRRKVTKPAGADGGGVIIPSLIKQSGAEIKEKDDLASSSTDSCLIEVQIRFTLFCLRKNVCKESAWIFLAFVSKGLFQAQLHLIKSFWSVEQGWKK